MLAGLALALALFRAPAQDPGGIAAWDTGRPSAAALSPEVLAARTGWSAVPRDQTLASFKGDAVVTNGRLLVVARRLAAGAEVYSAGPGGAVPRAVLSLAAAEPAARLERASLAENARGGACLELAWRTAGGAELAARLRLKRGAVAVELEPGPGAARARIEAPCRYVALPDFFADDILIDAARLPLASAELPSENFLLHFLGKGDAIAVAVFENRDQDVRIALSGEGDRRAVAASEIDFGKQARKVWLAVVTGQDLWHAVEVRAEDAGKAAPLSWKMPFPAQWRVDFTRTNDLTDSWEMIHQKEKGGEYLRQEWFDDWQRKMGTDRKRWTTVLGRFSYPCWVDHDRQAWLQPLKHAKLAFRGPALLYPINRVKETPAETFTVVDVVRSTLGMGPCEYILDLEGQKENNRGINTCSVRDRFNEIFPKGQQKEKRKEMEKLLDDTLAFVTHIRKRIEEYLEFARTLRGWLGEQRKKRPELERFLAEVEEIVTEIEAREAVRRDKMKTPAWVAQLNDDFRKNGLGLEGPEAVEKAKKYGQALTEVGDNQDELVGECRWIVKTVRQKAGLAMATDPKAAGAAEEIRAMTQKILRNPNALERARH